MEVRRMKTAEEISLTEVIVLTNLDGELGLERSPVSIQSYICIMNSLFNSNCVHNFRRRKMRNRFYIPSSVSQRDDLPLWDLESLENETYKSTVPSHLFAQHTEMLAADSNIGFRKEFDFIISSWTGPLSTGHLK